MYYLRPEHDFTICAPTMCFHVLKNDVLRTQYSIPAPFNRQGHKAGTIHHHLQVYMCDRRLMLQADHSKVRRLPVCPMHLHWTHIVKSIEPIIQHVAQWNLSSCRAKYRSLVSHDIMEIALCYTRLWHGQSRHESCSWTKAGATTSQQEQMNGQQLRLKTEGLSVYWPPLQGIIYSPSNVRVINI